MDPTTILLCTDGSDLALRALRDALPVLAPATRTIVVTVTPAVDPSLVTGTGFASGVITIDQQEALLEQERTLAQRALDDAVSELGLTHAETMILTGDPGEAICDLAEALPASVVVLGTRGRTGIRRAVLGSTSDHVVRHAVCPVLVQGGG